MWCARDAVVLKALALVLIRHLRLHLSEKIFHLAVSGGPKAAVRVVAREMKTNRFVFRTDVKSYYASIDHDVLMVQLRRLIRDRMVLRLVHLYLHHLEECGGTYREVSQGLCLGCPPSPLMGALFLKHIGEAIELSGLTYVRFMDDWVTLSPTRWKLRRAVAAVNRILSGLRLAKHPDKTFIGYIARGFDFLGYHFSPDEVARKTVRNFAEKVVGLCRVQGGPCSYGRLC